MRIIVPLAIAVMGAAAPAQAVIFQYFEGNNCTQKRLGSADAESLKDSNLDSLSWNLQAQTVETIIKIFAPMSLIGKAGRYNDEVRSVRIFSNWRTTQESRNPAFTVYDSPQGRTNDDWAKIYVSDAMLIPDKGVCVGSFEKSFNKYGIRLERHPNNGLDGKVSHMKISCDTSCRANLTVK